MKMKVIFLTLWSIPVLCEASCSKGWSLFQEKCIRIFGFRELSWNEANADCQDKGAYLAKNDDMEMRKFIRSLKRGKTWMDDESDGTRGYWACMYKAAKTTKSGRNVGIPATSYVRYSCEAESPKTISCPNGGRIKIRDAVYGRADTSRWDRTQCGGESGNKCKSHDLTDQARKQCDYEESCVFNGNDYIIYADNDPCKNLNNKFTRVRFSCTYGDGSGFIVGDVPKTACYLECSGLSDYGQDGTCELCPKGYCCREDGVANKCSEDVTNAIQGLSDNPNGHMCFLRAGTDFEVQKGHIFQTLPLLHKQWYLSVDIMPTALLDYEANILRITSGNPDPTDTILRISFDLETTRMKFSSSINSNNWETNVRAISLNQWTKVEVSQQVDTSGKYRFWIRRGGKLEFETEIDQPQDLTDVKIFASDDQSQTAAVRIDNVFLDTFADDQVYQQHDQLTDIPTDATICNITTITSFDQTEPDKVIDFHGNMQSVQLSVQTDGSATIWVHEFEGDAMERGNYWRIVFGAEGGMRTDIYHKETRVHSERYSSLFSGLDHNFLNFKQWQNWFEFRMSGSTIGLYTREGFSLIEYGNFDGKNIRYFSVSTEYGFSGIWWLNDRLCDEFGYTQCKDGWTKIQNKCARVFPAANKNWWDARDACVELDSHLAKIDNDAMNHWLTSLSDRSTEGHVRPFWIGATDATEEGIWTDVNGEVLTFSSFPWGSGPPNINDRDNCANSHYSIPTVWNDNKCELVIRWACLYDLPLLCNFDVETAAEYNFMPVLEGRDNIHNVRFSVEALTDIHIAVSKHFPVKASQDTIEIILGAEGGKIRRSLGNSQNDAEVQYEQSLFDSWTKNFELRLSDNTLEIYTKVDSATQYESLLSYDVDTSNFEFLYISTSENSNGIWNINPGSCLTTIPPEEQTRLPSTLFVEYHCESERLIKNTKEDSHMVCTNGQHIKIQDAIFGRIDGGSQCGGNPFQTNPCTESLDLTSQARERCDGKKECFFTGSSDLVESANEPCAGIPKYTRIRFVCYSGNGTEYEVQRGHVYTNMVNMYPDWYVTLDIMPTETISNPGNILWGIQDGALSDDHGDYIPQISFNEDSTELQISSSINTDPDLEETVVAIPMNEWTRIEVYQIDNVRQVRRAGKIVAERENLAEKDFSNVHIMTGAALDGDDIAKAKINNIKIDTWDGYNQENLPSFDPKCNVEVTTPSNGNYKTVINYPELMTHVRFNVISDGEVRLLLTEFDDEHLHTGRNWEIRVGSNSGTTSTIHNNQGVAVKTLDHTTAEFGTWLNHFELKLTETTIGIYDESGQIIIEYEEFDSAKLHYLSVSTHSEIEGQWGMSDGSCDYIPTVTDILCRSGWHAIQNKCVKIFGHSTGEGTAYASWFTARRECEEYDGSYLAIPENDEMNKFIASLSPYETWLGLSDLDEEGYWIDVFDRPATFTSWATGEPNNCCGGTSSYFRDNCAQNGHGSRWNWNDRSCYSRVIPDYACMSDGWDAADVANLQRGFDVTEGLELSHFPRLYKQWHLEFEFMPLSLQPYTRNTFLRGFDAKYISVAATNNKNMYKWYGEKLPELQVDAANGLSVAFAHNDRAWYSFLWRDTLYKTKWPIRTWTKFEMSQIRQANGTYIISLSVNGTLFGSVINDSPKVFKDVTVGAVPDMSVYGFYYSRPAKMKLDNYKFETWPDSVSVKSSHTKTLGGCKNREDQEHGDMVCKTRCSPEVLGGPLTSGVRFSWVLNTDQTLLGRIKLKSKHYEISKDEPFIGVVRFERKVCSHELLTAIETHDAVRFVVSDLNSGNHWMESISYIHDMGEKWERTGLFVQFRRGNNEPIESYSDSSEDDNVIYVAFQIYDKTAYSQDLLQTCLSSAHLTIIRDDSEAPFTTDYTRCVAYSRYDLSTDWTENQFIPAFGYTDTKTDPSIGGCKPDATYGRENGKMGCVEDCNPRHFGSGTDLNFEWRFKTPNTFGAQLTVPLRRNTIISADDPYVGVIRLEKKHCGHALLKEIVNRGAVRFDVGDLSIPEDLDTNKYHLESITYPFNIGEKKGRSSLFVQFKKTGPNDHELTVKRRDSFFIIMTIYADEQLPQLGIKRTDIEECLASAHLSVMKTEAVSNDPFDDDYTRCVAFKHYGIPVDWTNSTFIQETFLPKVFHVPEEPKL